MRRSRSPVLGSRTLLLAATAGLALVASACGVTANTNAATVAGRDIPIEDVTALAADPAFNGGQEPANESVEDGQVARSVLSFLIEREVWLAELERWGLSISDDDRAAAGDQLDEQLQSSGTAPLESRSRELLIDYGAAQSLLTQRFAQLDAGSDDDLRQLYRSAEVQWRQVCLTVVQVPIDRVDDTESAIDDGTAVDGLPEQIDGAEAVADPSQGCFTEAGLAPELRVDLEGAAIGVTRGVVLTADGSGGANAYVYRLEGRRNLSFADARDDLASAAQSLAQQGPAQWVQLIALGADVNPRYGQDVVRSSTGFTVEPPQRPERPRAQRIADAIAAAEAAQAQALSGAADGATTTDGTASTDGSTAGG